MSRHATIDDVRQQFDRDLASAASEGELRAVRDRYLARKGGLVSSLLKAWPPLQPTSVLRWASRRTR